MGNGLRENRGKGVGDACRERGSEVGALNRNVLSGLGADTADLLSCPY